MHLCRTHRSLTTGEVVGNVAVKQINRGKGGLVAYHNVAIRRHLPAVSQRRVPDVEDACIGPLSLRHNLPREGASPGLGDGKDPDLCLVFVNWVRRCAIGLEDHINDASVAGIKDSAFVVTPRCSFSTLAWMFTERESTTRTLYPARSW